MPDKSKTLVLLLIYLTLFVVGFLLVLYPFTYTTTFSTYNLGKTFGIWAFTCLCLQFVLSSRSKLLEKRVGLDTIMRFHSLNAKLLFVLALCHPFLLGVVGNFNTYSIFHWIGMVAFLLLVFTVITTIYSDKFKINYEHWKIIHKVAYVILVFVVTHSLYLGSDLMVKGAVFYWWLFLFVLALWGILTRVMSKKHEFEVVGLVRETHNVRSILLKPLQGKVFDFMPGQFAFVRFFGDISPEEHHFTISSSPGEKCLTFSIKELGDYTSSLSKLKKGDKAILDGPYGAFTNADLPGPFLFIAGGIGITPVMSMLRYMSKNSIKEDSVLLYIQKTKKDLVFDREIKSMAKEGWLKVYCRFTEKEGRPDRKFLEKVGDIKSRTIFLVGPAQMIKDTKILLLAMGVSSEKIKTEQFVLR